MYVLRMGKCKSHESQKRKVDVRQRKEVAMSPKGSHPRTIRLGHRDNHNANKYPFSNAWANIKSNLKGADAVGMDAVTIEERRQVRDTTLVKNKKDTLRPGSRLGDGVRHQDANSP